MFVTQASSQPIEPTSITEALSDPSWKSAMDDEYGALMKNKIWMLVPRMDNMNVVRNNWLYKVKYNQDGTI